VPNIFSERTTHKPLENKFIARPEINKSALSLKTANECNADSAVAVKIADNTAAITLPVKLKTVKEQKALERSNPSRAMFNVPASVGKSPPMAAKNIGIIMVNVLFRTGKTAILSLPLAFKNVFNNYAC
jgi:hypothetical protein